MMHYQLLVRDQCAYSFVSTFFGLPPSMSTAYNHVNPTDKIPVSIHIDGAVDAHNKFQAKLYDVLGVLFEPCIVRLLVTRFCQGGRLTTRVAAVQDF